MNMLVGIEFNIAFGKPRQPTAFGTNPNSSRDTAASNPLFKIYRSGDYLYSGHIEQYRFFEL